MKQTKIRFNDVFPNHNLGAIENAIDKCTHAELMDFIRGTPYGFRPMHSPDGGEYFDDDMAKVVHRAHERIRWIEKTPDETIARAMDAGAIIRENA